MGSHDLFLPKRGLNIKRLLDKVCTRKILSLGKMGTLSEHHARANLPYERLRAAKELGHGPIGDRQARDADASGSAPAVYAGKTGGQAMALEEDDDARVDAKGSLRGEADGSFLGVVGKGAVEVGGEVDEGVGLKPACICGVGAAGGAQLMGCVRAALACSNIC